MSNIPQPGNIVTSVLNASGKSAAQTNTATFQTIASVGTVATIVSSTSQQLSLNLASGKVALPAAKIPVLLEPGKAISFKINSESTPNLLDISARYVQQRLTLTPQQSQLVIQTIVQTPSSLASNTVVKGTVLSLQPNAIQLNVNGETLNLVVKNPQEYRPGQQVKLALNNGTLGWEAQIQTEATKESLRLPAKDTEKLLQKLPASNVLELSESGRQKLKPILNKLTDSLAPEQFDKIQLKANHGRLTAQLEFGSKPIVSIQLPAKLSSELQILVQKTVQAESDKLVSPATEKKAEPVLLSKKPGESHYPNTNAATYKVAINSPGIEASPELAKTISDSQSQFHELKIKPVIPEIRISEQKAQLQQLKQVKADSNIKVDASKIDVSKVGASIVGERNTGIESDPKVEKSTIAKTDATHPAEPAKVTRTDSNNTAPGDAAKLNEVKAVLSSSAQQILQTLKAINANSNTDLRQTIFTNIEKIIATTVSASQQNNVPLQPQIRDVLQSLKQLSEQTSKPGEGQLQKLSIAVDEIAKNLNISDSIKQHIKAQMPQVTPGSDPVPAATSQAIKQLLQTPTMPITPVSLVAASGGGMVAGLINLLQVSLAARLNRSNTEVGEKIQNTISQLVGTSVKSAGPQKASTSGLRDLSQLEQKHNMVKLLSDAINQHSKQKLQNAERTLQGQEAFYYVLPFRQSDSHAPPELLVTREKDEEQTQNKDSAENRAWLLTMKLSVGELGELLAKTKVNDELIKVDFYTSNTRLKDTVLEHLPALKKRFDSLGLTMEIGRCELGQIPEHLAHNPYQILQTRA